MLQIIAMQVYHTIISSVKSRMPRPAISALVLGPGPLFAFDVLVYSLRVGIVVFQRAAHVFARQVRVAFCRLIEVIRGAMVQDDAAHGRPAVAHLRVSSADA